MYFWHSEGWTPRNEALLEAVLKQAKTTRHPWLIACGANMCPGDFEKELVVSNGADARRGSAEGAAWLQWMQAARMKHNRKKAEKKRRKRITVKIERIRNEIDQETGCGRQEGGKWA